jgi:hypothetical protein
MTNDSSGDSRRHLLTASGAIGLAALVTGKVAASTQEEEQTPRSRGFGTGETIRSGPDGPRSRRISEEVVVGSSVARSADYNESKTHSLIQVIEHVFKEEEDPAAGYPVTREKAFKVAAATKLAIVTVSGFELWFGTSAQEIMAASSRYGFHAGLEPDFGHGTLTAKVRANWRFWGKADRDWTWRCHVVIQCFGQS